MTNEVKRLARKVRHQRQQTAALYLRWILGIALVGTTDPIKKTIITELVRWTSDPKLWRDPAEASYTDLTISLAFKEWVDADPENRAGLPLLHKFVMVELEGGELARYGILWKPFRLFPATDTASRKCSSIRI
ncbi:hypothetical protein [Shewanella algae]|uniref:hypothetical protein n=1 Tax=Shewanella algae TaxID=38313 RepID=UPI0030069E06